MPRSPVVPWALRIDRLPGNHRITLNGIPLSSRHMEGDAITSVASLPYLIELPVNVLLAGDNDLDIEVRGERLATPEAIRAALTACAAVLEGTDDAQCKFAVNDAEIGRAHV